LRPERKSSLGRYHRPIGPEEYEELCRRVAEVVRKATPADAVVAVVSKGDPRLLEFEGRSGVHFPLDDEGRYAGFHPEGSEDAIAWIESIRAAGTHFLCLPATAFWWLDHYQGLANWLTAHCDVVARDDDTCVVYDLVRAPGAAPHSDATPPATTQIGPLLDALLPDRALLLALGPVENLASAGRTFEQLPPDPDSSLRRLAGLKDERPAFIVVARSATSHLDHVLESFLSRRTELIARRQQLCDLLRLKPPLDDGARISGESRSAHPAPDPAESLEGEAAKRLSDRLERLGLPGQDSSGA
jgi:hypothetical protein